MALTRTVAPTDEPVTVAEVKPHLRVDTADDNTLIGTYITAAREHCEHFTRRQLVWATWRLTLDAFPTEILLPRPPLVSVTSLAYTDSAGDAQTLTETTDFVKDERSEPARLWPAYGESWPGTYPVMNAVTITYVAGHCEDPTDDNTVPAPLILGIQQLVSHWHENREPILIGAISSVLPNMVEQLWWPYRILDAV